MKKIMIAAIAAATGLMLLGGCGKSAEPAVSYIDEASFDGVTGTQDGYELTVEVRKNSAVSSEDAVSFITSRLGDEVLYYGTASGGEYWRKESAGDTVTYLNDGFYDKVCTKDEYDLPFKAYADAAEEFFTYENLKNAVETGNGSIKIKKIAKNWSSKTGRTVWTLPEEKEVNCKIFSLDTTGLISIWDTSGSYDKMTTTCYLDENKKLVYAVNVLMDTNESGNNKTITLSKNGSEIKIDDFGMEYVSLKEYGLKRQGLAVAEGGKTTQEIVNVSNEDIENQTADGYYYADGSYSVSNPDYSKSWVRKIDKVEVEKYDFETDTYTNLTTGEITAEYTKDMLVGSHAVDAINNTDIYSMTFAQITSNIMGYSADKYFDWKYLCGYNFNKHPELESHPEGVPEDIREMIEKVYNTYTVQYVIDHISDLTEEEKIYISYLAVNEDFTVQNTNSVTILFSDVLRASGLEPNEYAMRRYELWQDASNFYNN